jgi:predicted ribosomally synthesized peptide with SipW-like signal peptide
MVLSKERKRLLLVIALVAVAITLIGAGTYAYFSATVTTETINFTAGTIDLSVNGSSIWNSVSYNETFNDLKPCQKRWVNVTVKNNGTNPMYAWLSVCNLSNGGGLHPQSEMGEDPLNSINMIEDVIRFDLYENSTLTMISDNDGYVINDTVISPQNWSTKSVGCKYIALNFTANNVGPYHEWQPGEVRAVNMSYMLACNTTNWAQGDNMTFRITLFALQSEGWENSPTGTVNPSEVGIQQINFP